MCKGAWLFCRRGARLILWTIKCVLIQMSMPATFSLALWALFNATTSPQPLRPSSCSLAVVRRRWARPFMVANQPCPPPSPSRSTICSGLAVLGWHLSRCHFMPVPGLVIPNASGCVAVALSAPLADSMPVVPLARPGVVPSFVRIDNSIAKGQLPSRIGISVHSRVSPRLYTPAREGLTPLVCHVGVGVPPRVDFSRVRIGKAG